MPPISNERQSLEHQVVSDCILGWRRATQQRARQQQLTQWTDEEYALLSQIRHDQTTKSWGVGIVAAIGVLGFLRVAPVRFARAVERYTTTVPAVKKKQPSSAPNSPFTKATNEPTPWFRLTFEENKSNLLFYWGWVIVDLSVAGFCGTVVADVSSTTDELTTSARSIFPPAIVPLNGPYTAFHCPIVEQGIDLRLAHGGGAAQHAIANPETDALRSLVDFYHHCRKRNSKVTDFPEQYTS